MDRLFRIVWYACVAFALYSVIYLVLQDSEYALVAVIAVLILLPPKWDPAIRWKERNQPKPCPHGYEDWDYCPDCCH